MISDAKQTYLNDTNKNGISFSNPLKNVNEYKFLEDCLLGSGGFYNNYYISPHVREPLDRYDRRRSQAYYLNIFCTLIEANTLPLFEKEPVRKYNESSITRTLVEMFLKNCDLKGSSFNSFMKNALQWAHVDGASYILVENFEKVNEDIKSTIEQRKIPYLTFIRAKNLYDFSEDDYGVLESFTYFYKSDKDNNPIYINITNEFYSFVDKDLNLIEGMNQIKNTLGVIPVVPLNAVDQYQFKPLSNFYQVGRMGYRLFNLNSEIQEQESNSMYPILTKPSDRTADKQDVGTSNGIEYDKDSPKPDYISPPVDPIKVLQDSEKMLIEKMFIASNMTFMTDSSNVSAEAKKWAFKRTDTALNEFALSLEDCENKIFDMFGRFISSDILFEVTYNRSFGVMDIEQIFSEITQLLEIEQIGRKGKSLIVNNLIDTYYSYADQEFVNEIKKSIDDELINNINSTNDNISEINDEENQGDEDNL